MKRFHILHEHSGEGIITTSFRREMHPKLLRALFDERYFDRGSSGVLYGIGNGIGRIFMYGLPLRGLLTTSIASVDTQRSPFFQRMNRREPMQ